jgi:hypothetical protein
MVQPGCDRDRVLRRLEQMLHDRFGITHTTLQMMEHDPGAPLIQVERGERP